MFFTSALKALASNSFHLPPPPPPPPSSCPNITWLTDQLKINRLSLSLYTSPPPPPPPISITFSTPLHLKINCLSLSLSTPPPTPISITFSTPPSFENQLAVYPFHPPSPSSHLHLKIPPLPPSLVSHLTPPPILFPSISILFCNEPSPNTKHN